MCAELRKETNIITKTMIFEIDFSMVFWSCWAHDFPKCHKNYQGVLAWTNFLQKVWKKVKTTRKKLSTPFCQNIAGGRIFFSIYSRIHGEFWCWIECFLCSVDASQQELTRKNVWNTLFGIAMPERKLKTTFYCSTLKGF